VVTHRLMLEIIKRFREERIQIPFPQRDLYLKDMPASSADERAIPEA
jgi:small-conductance mechanosensitive channel